jgi:hypothetical protein
MHLLEDFENQRKKGESFLLGVQLASYCSPAALPFHTKAFHEEIVPLLIWRNMLVIN